MFKIPMHNFDRAGPRLGASSKIDERGQKSRTTWKWPNICRNIGCDVENFKYTMHNFGRTCLAKPKAPLDISIMT